MMNQQVNHFLLVFDHAAGQLVEIREFGRDSDAALVAYAEKENEFQDERRIEVVLIGSDSLETIKVTHANYFDGSVAVSRFLAGI
jgi:hypothetical protein